MATHRQLRKSILRGVAIAALCLLGSFASAAQQVWKFDCGPADSPVMDGYGALSGDQTYDQAAGFGWEGVPPSAKVFVAPSGVPGGRGGDWGSDYMRESTTDLTRDAVVSAQDLVFRADVPDGTYRVVLTIGDLSQAIGSMDVRINGALVGDQVAAWRPGGYRMLHRTPAGWWAYVRSTVQVSDGVIRIALTKNQTHYDNEMAEQATWGSPYLAWRPGPAGYPDSPPYYYIGYPFVHNSIMAIDIAPFLAPPVIGENEKLRLTKPIDSPALSTAIEAFNEADFEAAVGALARVTEPDAQLAKALVQLWLSGRLEVEVAEAFVPEAIEVLTPYCQAHPEETRLAEILQDAKIFQKALTLHRERGKLGTNHFIENDKAIGWWWLIKEDSPLYYKSQLFIAQAAHMLVPYIPALGTEGEILKKLEEKFPDNRYVRYFLHQEWEPHGDGTKMTDWLLEDYYANTEGAPEWARLLQAAWASQVDWAEWWIKFKQQPEGSIGGGLSDDVEMVGGLAYVAFVSRGVSDLTIAGARKLCEANWKYGGIDDQVGYSLPLADAEHTAEPTGDTLGLMLRIDYGSPLWIERSFKTGKLLRDFFTAPNVHGLRHFRSNYLGAGRVGGGIQANDSWINLRAALPAFAVLEYNRSPGISRVLVELADGWLRDAMSTERGKPRGVIPADVSFPDALIGGTQSPNWYTAYNPSGAVNYDWAGIRGQRYKGYMHQLLITAYKQTGNLKYVEPLKLEYQLADQYGYAPEEQASTRLTNVPWVRPSQDTRDGLKVLLQRWQPKHVKSAPRATAPSAEEEEAPAADQPLVEGSEQWVAKELKNVGAWLAVKRMMEGRKAELENDVTLEQVSDHAAFVWEMMKMRWPLMTSLASATDRVGFLGFPNALLIYTGGGLGNFAVTYADTTKYFAAAVMAADAQGFRLLYCNMTPNTREVGIVPWELEPAGLYRLTYGPDADLDGEMDSLSDTRDFVFPQPGSPVNITVDPNVTYIVEVNQLERGRVAGLAPDPAVDAADIRFEEFGRNGVLLAKIHNVGSLSVKNVRVELYDGDPDAGGLLLTSSVIPNIESPDDLDPKAVTVAVGWQPSKESHNIYVVVDPDNEIDDEITSFNNVAHRTLPEVDESEPQPKELPLTVSGRR